jgi:hypothetical protein
MSQTQLMKHHPLCLDAEYAVDKVTKGLGTPTTWVGNNTQEAIKCLIKTIGLISTLLRCL